MHESNQINEILISDFKEKQQFIKQLSFIFLKKSYTAPSSKDKEIKLEKIKYYYKGSKCV